MRFGRASSFHFDSREVWARRSTARLTLGPIGPLISFAAAGHPLPPKQPLPGLFFSCFTSLPPPQPSPFPPSTFLLVARRQLRSFNSAHDLSRTHPYLSLSSSTFDTTQTSVDQFTKPIHPSRTNHSNLLRIDQSSLDNPYLEKRTFRDIKTYIWGK